MQKQHMPQLIEKYYRAWINSSTLFSHPNDEQKFYQFVKACLRYGRKRRNGQWLKYFLEKDLKEKYVDDYYEEQLQNAILLFDHFMEYERTKFPNHVLEMRNPYLVKQELVSIVKSDGTSYYSQEAIDKILIKYFGPNWEIEWQENAGIFPYKENEKK